MDFSLTKEQRDIKKAAAEFARGEFQPDLILECESNHRFPREIYKKAGELGFIGLHYPEEADGGGLGVKENVRYGCQAYTVDTGIAKIRNDFI